MTTTNRYKMFYKHPLMTAWNHFATYAGPDAEAIVINWRNRLQEEARQYFRIVRVTTNETEVEI